MVADKKTPLVLLPGTLCDGRVFSSQIYSISDRDVSVGDLTRDNTIAAMARRVLADAPPRFALLGHSMGGFVAFEILRQAPERVDRLALCDANPMHETPERRAGRVELMRAVSGGKIEEVVRSKLLPLYFAAENAENSMLQDLILQMAADLGPAVFESQSRATMSREDSRPTLDAIQAPTLLLCGAEDGLCTPAGHEMMGSRIANSKLIVLEGAGHFPMLECPDQTNAALHDWLN